MRIAVNARFLIKGKLEGIGWYTYEILRRMVQNHPEDEFILIHDRPLAEEYIFADNVKSAQTLIPSRHPILWYLWFEYSVPNILKKYKPDVFLSFDGYLSIKTDIPTVYVLHDLAYIHCPNEIPKTVLWFYQKFTPQYLERADRIVSVSAHGKQDLLQHFPHLQANTMDIVGNAARSIFKPLSKIESKKIRDKYSDGHPFFFYVGAVHPRKNISRLIQAFDIFSEQYPDCQLLIAGRNAWKTEHIQKTHDESKQKDKIKFLGYIEDDTMAKLMASAMAFVYPSLFEGFGVPVLEAMHCETPVITSQQSPMAEVTNNASLQIDPHITKDIAKALSNLYTNEGLREQLVQNGRIQREKYNWDTSAMEMYNILQKTIKK